MYYCPDCGYEFETALKLVETHSLSAPPFEEIYLCPCCKGKNFYEKILNHCRCCGAKLLKMGTDYCSQNCRIRGEKLWKKEMIRRKLNFDNPINIIVKEIDSYNANNKTNYSYGQYVALIRPVLKRHKKL